MKKDYDTNTPKVSFQGHPPCLCMTFNSDGLLQSVKDHYGNLLSFSYNAAGDLELVSDGTRRIVLTYDTAATPHHIVTVSDANHNIYSMQYNSGRLRRLTYPATDSSDGPAYWEYTYTPEGYMATKRDPVGNLISYSYQADGRGKN